MDPVQIIGSLVAIIALAGLAAWLKLGGTPVLASEAAARTAANAAIDGFAATRVGIDRAGIGAVLEDSDRRILVLKPHGNQFAGRLLEHRASASLEGNTLTIVSGERRFGTVQLTLYDGAYWANAINRLR